MPSLKDISASLLLAGQAAVNNLSDNVFNVPWELTFG